MKVYQKWKNQRRKRLQRVLAGMLCFCLMITACPGIQGTVFIHAAEAHGSHPACGVSCPHESAHENLTWEPFTSTGGELTSGNYYLTEDVTLSTKLTISSGNTVNLCLNGHEIIHGGSSDMFTVYGTLTICDCVGGGVVNGASLVAVYMKSSGIFNLYGGTITGNYTTVISGDAGNTIVNLYGGTITGGRQRAINIMGKATIGGNTKVISSSGCAVINNHKDAVLTVQDNAYLSSNGIGLNCYGTTIINGGTVNGATYGINVPATCISLTINGAPVISGTTADVLLRTAAGTTRDNAKVDATGYVGGVLTAEEDDTKGREDAYAIKVSDGNKDKFTLTNNGWSYLYKDGGLYLHTHSYTYTADGENITESCACGHEETATLSLQSGADLTYIGSAIKPVTITYSDGWGGNKPADTAINYTNNINAGTATAKLTVSGATASLNFTITSAEMSGVSASGYTGTYDGEYHSIKVTAPAGALVKYGINEGTYQMPMNPSYDTVGTHTVYYQVTKSNYKPVTGSATVIIKACGISGADVVLNSTTLTYNGSEQTKEVSSVTVNNKTLTEGTDYTISGNKGTNAGTYTLTITGKRNYSGTASTSFTIAGKPLEDSMVSIASGPHYHTGNAVTPDVTVMDGSTTLTNGTDYTVSYKDNTNAGTAAVTVTGKGNYTGTIKKTFDIILTDTEKVEAAKKVVGEILTGITATNKTTQEEIQSEIDAALAKAGIRDVTVTVGDFSKTEATTTAAGSISGNVAIECGSASDRVTVSKTIAQLPTKDAEKVAAAKEVVGEALAGITATNETTKESIQQVIDTALTNAGIEDVTVTVGDLTRTEATSGAEGSVSGSITIKCGSETDSVSVNKTIPALGEVSKDVEKDEKAPNTTLSTSAEELADIVLTEEEKAQVENGTNIKFILNVKDIGDTVNISDKAAVQAALSGNTEVKGFVVGQYLDISLFKIIGTDRSAISQTARRLTIVIDVPDSLKSKDSTKPRTFAIVRVHDGVAETLADLDNDVDTITIATDRFSAYAIVYKEAGTGEDVKPSPTPGGSVKPSPTPGGSVKPTPSPIEETKKASIKEKRKMELHSGLKAVQTGKKLQISWGRVTGADGYSVYVQYCGKNFRAKPLKQVKGGKKTKLIIKKVNGRKLDTTKNFKLYVVAWRWKNGKKSTLAKTLTVHIAGKDSVKYTNVKSIRVKKTSYTLKKGSTITLKPKAVLYDRQKKQLSAAHTKEFRYLSSNKKVAVVMAGGKIKAEGAGSCIIYVLAKNGCKRKIKIKVKK